MKNIEIRHLRAFIAVAEELSYRKAASRLHVAQPALSRTIQQLESELGAQLLERNTCVVRMTETGRFLLENARAILGSLRGAVEAVQRMKDGLTGELLVGFNDFTIAELLPPIVQRFRTKFPEVTLKLIDQTSPRMLELVLSGQLDVAFLSGVVPPPELESAVLREERLVALLPHGHRLAKRRGLRAADLAGEPFVLGEPAWSVFLDFLDGYCRGAGFRPRVVQTAVHSSGIVNFVAAGIGVSIYVDRQWLRRRKDLIVRRLPAPATTFHTLAVWRRTGRCAALDNLIATMREVLSSETDARTTSTDEPPALDRHACRPLASSSAPASRP